MLNKYTPEQMTELRAKALAAREQKAIELKANEHLYKLTYMDSGLWQELASKYKVRMPGQNVPASVPGMRKYLKKCGLQKEDWEEAFGKMGEWVALNRAWTLYAATGLMLEMKNDTPR